MATEQRPLRLRFELRDDASPAPRVYQGGWVKVGAVATGERFWCRVMIVSADGILTASVDNDLLESTIACCMMFFSFRARAGRLHLWIPDSSIKCWQVM